MPRHHTLLLLAASLAAPVALLAQRGPKANCDPDNGGIKLPPGFCATVFADSIQGARHLVVAPNGDVFVSMQGRAGGIIALRDADKDGHAEKREQFATGFTSSEVALFEGHLYTEALPMRPPGSAPAGGAAAPVTVSILRFPMKAGELLPSGPPDTIVAGLPSYPDHVTRNFAITREAVMFVNVGSGSNTCQKKEAGGEPGVDPCPELAIRAGIWKFDARKQHQTEETGEHFARGIRNAVGVAISPVDGKLWTTQHGRDELKAWRSQLSLDSLAAIKFSAEAPAEELFQVNQGDDYGWPYCYFDPMQQKKVLAPEYGGDGKSTNRCADKKSNVAFFPGHWAPNALMFYTGSAFPAKYRNGAFIAFHGSWNRDPMPQAGFNVVFQPLQGGKASGPYEVFADGFSPSSLMGRANAASGAKRPTGLAQGPDGALYVAADVGGRIWKIVYTGR
jgi:glucose/arabinose dehydrogenase